jgi:hypothetical protein
MAEGKTSPPIKEPTPPPPESPGKGIEVEVYQPEVIYKLSHELADKGEIFSEIGSSRIDDHFLKVTSADLWSRGAQKGNEYFFRSWFHFADDVSKRPDFGYYDTMRIEVIDESLKDRGYSVKYRQEPASITGLPMYSLSFSKKGQGYEINFGFPSRQIEEEHLKKEAECYIKEDPDKFGYMTERTVHRINEGLNNRLIWFEAEPRRLALSKEDEDNELYDGEGEFVDFINQYAEVHEDVLNALYVEAGV